jgi:hydroxymethylbilane synthase
VSVITVGTRGSALALTQANMAASALRQAHPGLEVRIKTITTIGDRILDVPLSKIGDKGLFVKELEAALLDSEIDLAVHSAKDLPSQLPDGLTLAAFLPRGDARDALVLRASSTSSGRYPLDALPAGARVGTSSPRRICQLRALRPDLHIEDIRGNVDTRLRKLADGQFDALVLAAAGLERLGLIERGADDIAVKVTLNHAELVAIPVATALMLPAVAQGTLAVECRASDARTNEMLTALDDAGTRIATLAERSFLRVLEGGCQAPIAAHARVNAGQVHLTGLVGSLDGTAIVKRDTTGAAHSAEQLGARLAEHVIAGGGRAILARLRAASRQPSRPLSGMSIVITRAESRAASLVAKLRELGATPILYPVIAYAPPEDMRTFDAAMQRLMRCDYDWLALTSATSVEAIHDWLRANGAQPMPRVRIAAVGPATAQACEALLQHRATVVPEADAFNATSLATVMGVQRGERVLLLNADIAKPDLQAQLQLAGAQVDRVIAYRTIPAPPSEDVDLSALLRAKAVHAVLFTSGSTVRHFVERLDPHILSSDRNLLAVCIGPSTAEAAREAGFTSSKAAETATEDGLIETLVQAVSQHIA